MNWPILILGGYLVLPAWDLVTGSNRSRDYSGNHDSSQPNGQADDEAIVYFFDQQTSDNDS